MAASDPSPQSSASTRPTAPFYNLQIPMPTDPAISSADLQRLRQEDAPSAAHALAAAALPPSYGQAVPLHARQPISPERVAQGVLSIDQQSPTMVDADAAASAKKRSKVSRACDECRRKKIRCDAPSEDVSEPCANCKKVGASCAFSRQPLKRGPSKGYIRDLAERLHSLENQLGPQASQPSRDGQRFSYSAPPPVSEEAFYPQESPAGTRKRKLTPPSTTSAREEQLTEGTSSQASPRDRFRYPRQTGTSTEGQEYPGTPMTTSPLLQNNQFARQEPFGFGSRDFGRRNTLGEPLEVDERITESSLTLELDEGILDEYYRLIHETFPFLPQSKTRLKSRLSRCSQSLQDAFRLALDSAIRTYPSSNFSERPDTSEAVRGAAGLLSNYQFEPAESRTTVADLTYIQILILLSLESDNHGPATMRGQAGPPRAEWLGRAIGMATHLKLNTVMPRDRYGEGDPDGDEKMGRRIWWVLFILDRWHASSTSGLLQLPENGTAILREDQILLGTPAWNLVRLSHILGHLSQILQQPPSLMSPASPASGIITTTILGEIDRFRESVESVLLTAPNLVHLCYWHVKLMVMRLTSSTTPHELLAPAMRMATSLNSSYTTITPLNHHFAALSAMTLCELAEFEQTREGAQKGIEDIIDALGTKRGFALGDDSAGWDSAIRELVTKRRRRAMSAGDSGRPGENTGLQHLADAAIGDRSTASSGGSLGMGGHRNSEDGSAGSVFDPTLMTRYGYLAALVQETV